MNYRDNQPTFNVNRKVANFKDFATDKEKLAKADLQRKPNSEDQQHLGNKRTEYNPVTHKLTDYSDDEIKDRLDSMEEETNEGIFSDRWHEDNDDFYEPNKVTYSEEEVIQLLIKFNQEIHEVENVREWFEKFKK
jgi:hypothetical protein